MKLSRKQRAQVVELLRCAADLVHETAIPLTRAVQYLHGIHDIYGHDEIYRIWRDARDAKADVMSARQWSIVDAESAHESLLEAAQRLEEGSL